MGPTSALLTLFPEDETYSPKTRHYWSTLRRRLAFNSMAHIALLVQGDDKLGALADIHEKLYAANVNVYASSGVTDGRGGFGYVVYIRPDQFEQACGALNV